MKRPEAGEVSNLDENKEVGVSAGNARYAVRGKLLKKKKSNF